MILSDWLCDMGSLDEWCSARELWWWDFCDASKLEDGNYSKHSLQACVSLTRSIVPIGIITMTTVVESFHLVIYPAFIRCDWNFVVRFGSGFQLYVDVNDALAKSWRVTCQLHMFGIFSNFNNIWYFIKMMISQKYDDFHWKITVVVNTNLRPFLAGCMKCSANGKQDVQNFEISESQLLLAFDAKFGICVMSNLW